ncbi:hypothetical protein C8J57DRAFT_1243438 [Mycena rebaudengoi]|nr:hypothetical protein C8J57DRAFT_1243438 [Mycena rebaudengoi]
MASLLAQDEPLAAFQLSKRKIRDVELIVDDLAPLQAGSKLKVTGTLLNAVGALIQLVAEQQGNTDFTIFSSWLSPLIARQVRQGTAYGTIAGLIEAACQGQSAEMLLAKARWLFPMCGSSPPHWVLGWMELGAREFHIFDGLPELQSYMWAEPVQLFSYCFWITIKFPQALTELGQTVYLALGKRDMDLPSWNVLKHSPSELQRQMNGWACGFFVIDAINAVASGESTVIVANDRTVRVQKETLDLILTNLAFLEPKLSAGPAVDIAENVVVHATPNPMQIIPTTISDDVEMPAAEIEEPSSKQNEITIEQSNKYLPPVTSGSGSKRKEPPQKVTTKPLKKRTKKTSPEERETQLLNSEWAETVEAHRVLCVGCKTWIVLDSSQKFKLDNWQNHENSCPHITGKRRVRKVVTKPYGGPVTPSIAGLFDPGPHKPTPRPPPLPAAPLEPKSCKHLSGDKYMEYIERTETRSMGGVSTELRGRIARQVLFHKKFPPLKNDSLVANGGATEQLIPSEGNDCIASPDWTLDEHDQLHGNLRGFSRWVVHYAKKTVASAHCEDLTANLDQVCNACLAVSKDESLQRSIRRHVMVRQRILLSGTFKEKRERKAGLGYVLDFDASALTPEDRKIAQVTLTDTEMNSLVEIAFKEASLLCTQFLHIPAPKPTTSKPVLLTPLGAPAAKAQPRPADEDSDLETDDEDADDIENEAVPEPFTRAGDEDSRGISLAAHDAARYSALCEDYDDAVRAAETAPVVFGPPPPPLPTAAAPIPTPVSLRSNLIDDSGKLSVTLILKAQLQLQSGTTTRSEKTVQIDSKYALGRISRGIGLEGDDDTNPEKMTHQEASQLTRIAQDIGDKSVQTKRPQKVREMRWKNLATKVQNLVDSRSRCIFL